MEPKQGLNISSYISGGGGVERSHSEGKFGRPGEADQRPAQQDKATQDLGQKPVPLRFRFNVRYVGSALLHRNFTMPMLEWIARDIKRQTTTRGAAQRQFAIPTRDIVFEIQQNKLTAISSKDQDKCIFVHPMHCVSKYAQLQHDPTCFAYIIRDSKEAPSFCHVFQAKRATKVHEIFSAIRETTTSLASSAEHQQQRCSPGGGGNKLQKSASSDGYWKSLLTASSESRPSAAAAAASSKLSPPQPQSLAAGQQQVPAAPQQQRQQVTSSAVQFENSYQFEVMFVKRVKLQCRRVPASFVDDALETLKSFEVLKGGGLESKKQSMKGLTGKRLINASVDERQEYDDDEQQQTATLPVLVAPRLVAQPQTELAATCASLDERRRGSSASLGKAERPAGTDASLVEGEFRESKSCQQSPTKQIETFPGAETASADSAGGDGGGPAAADLVRGIVQRDANEIKKHQSIDCLKSCLDETIKFAKSSKSVVSYSNDFSPYNTITSSDLNEQIAAIPVVSSSVSLDHETRQKLARQVRETIMATAANIKKDVYASCDKLNSSRASFKALDSLSCNAEISLVSANEDEDSVAICVAANSVQVASLADNMTSVEQLTCKLVNTLNEQQTKTNNFDLFRRASARQGVKNRTMLLLIGKDELCAISIDKHQVLFSKSFNSIVHCLQGSGNKDHFGLICRDSGKINPSAESYVGFVFKCQSEKVVREIMGALKQVIYSSQHNYHGHNSPYNPLNSQLQQLKYKAIEQTSSMARNTSAGDRFHLSAGDFGSPKRPAAPEAVVSLAAKRSFVSPIELNEAAQLSCGALGDSVLLEPCSSAPAAKQHHHQSSPAPAAASQAKAQPSGTPLKNPIKSMFCDDCPLYWFHRLCCDVESLPAEASKAVILRRIDSSLSEKEQDELYSKFSDFKIESLDEHNEIFMSLLRNLCERKQLRHSLTQAHQSALAKSVLLTRQLSSASFVQTSARPALKATHELVASGGANQHQRSGSFGGGGQLASQAAAGQSIADASSLAIDNLKRAKNSISTSIENMLKRRSSMRDDQNADTPTHKSAGASLLPVRSGSFRGPSREARQAEQQLGPDCDESAAASGNLRRSQSTSDYAQGGGHVASPAPAASLSWKDSLTRTINDDLANNPLVGFFRRRGSFTRNDGEQTKSATTRASSESLSSHSDCGSYNMAALQEQQQHRVAAAAANGGSSPSSVLSSAFWKKSIFDKIHQATLATPATRADEKAAGKEAAAAADATARVGGDHVGERVECKSESPRKRSREELRSLWAKAILEQITLIKMDKQNQKLQQQTNGDANECNNIQRIKLNYRDVPFGKEASALWDKLLKQDPTKKVEFVDVARLVRRGVPKQRRGCVWMFLMNQYQLRHGTSFQPVDNDYRGDANQAYRSLLSQLSTQQHEIFVDIGRTFPSHPYYSQYLSIGQLSLFNLLKAYSLLDPEVGYCQGLSFVAGILLLHVDNEDEAFELMRHLLFNFGLRKQYLPSMNALHLQLYQLTRLLRDFEYDIFNHFDRLDISPSLYAAPWFLTLFASQFPLGFVSRLLDLVFLIGIEAIFRISLALLSFHRQALLDCANLESAMEFIKSQLVVIDDANLIKMFDKSLSLDLRNKLIEYEIEYSFYCAEDKSRGGLGSYKAAQKLPLSREKKRPELAATKQIDGNNDDDDGKPTSKAAANNGDNGNVHIVDLSHESTSEVADATATVIIQHLLANNHLRSLRSNYTY